jgi:hypothetical protein
MFAGVSCRRWGHFVRVIEGLPFDVGLVSVVTRIPLLTAFFAVVARGFMGLEPWLGGARRARTRRGRAERDEGEK